MYLGDNKSLEIMGKGNVCIKTSSVSKWKLSDVRCIPDLKMNMISIGHLDSTSYRAVFGEGFWKFVKGAMVIARGT